MKELKKEEVRAMLRELDKKEPPVELENLLCKLHLSMNVFFEGTVKRDGNKITLKIPNGQKFRITVEMAE